MVRKNYITMITFLPSLAKQCIKPFSRKQHLAKPFPSCTYLEKALFWRGVFFVCLCCCFFWLIVFLYSCKAMHWSCGILIHGTHHFCCHFLWHEETDLTRTTTKREKRKEMPSFVLSSLWVKSCLSFASLSVAPLSVFVISIPWIYAGSLQTDESTSLTKVHLLAHANAHQDSQVRRRT